MARARLYSWISLLMIQVCGAANPAPTQQAPAAHGGCAVIAAIPPIPGNAKSFADTQQSDASPAIQEALDSLKAGDWLVFSPGVYRIGRPLIVGSAGVTLYGQGATLLSTNATQGGLTVRGNDVAIYGFTLDQASTFRQSTPWAGGIAIYDERNGAVRRVRGTVIQHNIINHAAAAGIFIYTAENFTVADNTVWRSLADGIHMTAGASSGRVVGNTVSQSGDDMIAVVSYAGSSAIKTAAARYRHWSLLQNGLSRNIYIGSNRVFDQYSGRGISVVGGSQITVENNVVSRCPVAAGIYIERESSYRTFGVHDVMIRDNQISEIETAPPSPEPGRPVVRVTGHGAIEIGSLQDTDELINPRFRAAFSVSDVAIVDNEIQHTRFAAIRGGVGARNTVSRVLIQGNRLIDVGASSILETHPGLDSRTTRCVHNTLDGTEWASGCTRAAGASAIRAVPTATGAALLCATGGDRPPIVPAPVH